MDTTGLTYIGYCWTLMSMSATLCILAGFYIPFLLIGMIQVDSIATNTYFGLYRRCHYPVFDSTLQKIRLDFICGRYSTFDDIPSLFWQIATCSVGFGACLALLISLIAIPACCFKDIVSRTSALAMGIAQIISGMNSLLNCFQLLLMLAISIAVGCLLYPLGWDNREVRDACGQLSGKYLLGDTLNFDALLHLPNYIRHVYNWRFILFANYWCINIGRMRLFIDQSWTSNWLGREDHRCKY
jgi:hypothetical protein